MIIKKINKRFEKFDKERFDEIKKLTNQINHNNLIYHFKGNAARKGSDDFNNDMELFNFLEKNNLVK